MKQHMTGGKVILMSFLIALALTIVPLPTVLEKLRPEWVTMVLIYWSMALPDRVGVGVGWSVGLILDVLKDALLGQHALTLAIIAFLTIKLHQRVRVFPLWQQALTVLVLLIFQATLTLWIKGMLNVAPTLWSFLLPTLSTALLWPACYLVLRHVRRYYQVK